MARALFTKSQLEDISRAVADAETKTSAEIVTVIASRSGRYDRAEDLFAFGCSIIAGLIGWMWLVMRGDGTGTDWNDINDSIVIGITLLTIMVIAFALGMLVAARSFRLVRLLVSHQQMDEEMRAAAAAAFHRFRLRRTSSGAGVLVYVSVLERRALVIGDDGVNAVVNTEVWARACGHIVGGFREGQPGSAIEQAIRKLGDDLHTVLPADADDEDELHNAVHVLDPQLIAPEG